MFSVLLVLFLLCADPVEGALTFAECCVEGGVLTYDPGDGSTRSESYLCESNGEPPLDIIVPAEMEPRPREGAICCGSNQGLTILPPSNDLCLDLLRTPISRAECEAEGGSVVGDIGNGAIFRPDYLCEESRLPPFGTIVPSEGEPIASEGAVCCGPSTPGEETRDTLTRQECLDQGGAVVGDIGDGSIHRPGYLCTGSKLPPIGTVVPTEGEPIAIEGEVCCGAESDNTRFTRQECLENGGQIVGDIGDGAIHQPGYLCQSNNLPPLGSIAFLPGEPIASEGEVCCGPGLPFTGEVMNEVTGRVCEDEGGIVVGDIGNGDIFRPGYACESNGLPPIAVIVPAEGEAVAIDGAVCCGGEVDSPSSDIKITQQQCINEGGLVIADSGDGSVRSDDYVCATNDRAPIATITPVEGDLVTEVCCGSEASAATTGRHHGNLLTVAMVAVAAAIHFT